ncbi:MAG: NlpC/P60 family protein, partial [Eubacteriales bacterium]|nr:NlpC/P60 family protein [Eubacteriales bacterium]
VTPTPGTEVTPAPGIEVTPTPGTDVTPTPEPTATPSPAPTDELLTEKTREVIADINALAKVEITLEHEARIQSIRTKYEALTDEEKSMVSNYELLTGFEARIMELKAAEFDDKEKPDVTDGSSPTVTDVKIGTPVYYTNMVSNIHAGKEFYLDTLKNEYHLSFSDDFVSVMDSIEQEYKNKNKLTDSSDSRTDHVTTSADSLLVRNWQDIIAVYVYEKSQEGKEAFTLDASSKDDLAAIFEELNPVVRDKQNITHVSYGNRHINYYIKKNKIAREDRELLKKYVETDCKILCATVTAAKGFVRQSVGDDVSEERVNVIAAAYSLVGKVGYFWGGKSTVFGDDPSWGTAERVTAAGSNSTGTVRAYGLDCSGFVTWAVVNGYHDTSMQSAIGDGTSDQWFKAQVVSEQKAQPGDLVFQRGPEAGSDNHVGILCGKTDSGDWIAVHCSSSKNGVTVGEAYGASFRYIRQPSFYPSEAEVKAMEENGITSDETEVMVGNTLQDIIKKNNFTSKDDDKDVTIMDNVFADKDDIEVFIGS